MRVSLTLAVIATLLSAPVAFLQSQELDSRRHLDPASRSSARLRITVGN